MADFQIEETIYTHYSTKRYNKELVLNPGDKLANDSDLVDIAQRTMPAGYRARVAIHIDATIEKL